MIGKNCGYNIQLYITIYKLPDIKSYRNLFHYHENNHNEEKLSFSLKNKKTKHTYIHKYQFFFFFTKSEQLLINIYYYQLFNSGIYWKRGFDT